MTLVISVLLIAAALNMLNTKLLNCLKRRGLSLLFPRKYVFLLRVACGLPMANKKYLLGEVLLGQSDSGSGLLDAENSSFLLSSLSSYTVWQKSI